MRKKTVLIMLLMAAALLITAFTFLSWGSLKQFYSDLTVKSYMKKVYGDQFYVNDSGEFCLEVLRPGNDANTADIPPYSIVMKPFDQNLIKTNKGVTLEPTRNPLSPGTKELLIKVSNHSNQLLECGSDYTRFEKLIRGNWYELSAYDTVEKALITVNAGESAELGCSIWYPASENKIVLQYPNGYTVDRGRYRIIWPMCFNGEQEEFYVAVVFDIT